MRLAQWLVAVAVRSSQLVAVIWVGATNSGIGSLPNKRPSAAGNILLLSGRAGGLPDRSPVPGPAPGRGPGRSSGRSLDRPPDQPPDQRPAGPPAGPWAGPRAAPRNSPPAGPRTGPRAKSMLPRRWPAGFIGGAPNDQRVISDVTLHENGQGVISDLFLRVK